MATILLDVALGQNGQATGNWTIPTLTAGGTVNALTGTITPNLLTLPNGFSLSVGTTSTNTSSTVTFSLTTGSGTIAAPIVKGLNNPISIGDIPSVMELTYSTVYNAFVLQNPVTVVSTAFQGVFTALPTTGVVGSTLLYVKPDGSTGTGVPLWCVQASPAVWNNAAGVQLT